MEYAAAIFSALSDPIRLRGLALMAKAGELCVCELTFALDISQPTTSKHLALLREVGLVKDRRDAQWIFNGLAGGLPAWTQEALLAALAAIDNDPLHLADLARLKAMPSRPSRSCVA